MNEVTRIHLGRQPFTVSVEAHKSLKSYLADIEKNVADPDVVNEVETRMAELLEARGVKNEKVILPADVDYLKEQLGEPSDFSDEEDSPAAEKSTAELTTNKRLFRDTDNALLAGVSAGLANYFGLDVVLIRVLFIALTIFSGGLGVVIYIILWLLVPAATTSSEKLQMQGLQVTVDTLKQTVAKADLPGAARRANNALSATINTIFRIALKVIGIGFIVAGIATVLGLIAIKIYMALHHGQLFEENLFPVGTREEWLVNLGLMLAVLGSVFSVLIGLTIFRRKWPIRAWATIPLVSVFLITAACAGALGADVGPRVEARYQAGMHTTAVHNIKPFTKVESTGGLDLEYVSAPTYGVNLRYFDHPDLSKITITVADDGTLHIDSTAFDGSRHCDMLCLFPEYNMVVQISAPNVQSIDSNGGEVTYPPDVRFN